MRQHQSNALAVALYLENSKKVENVILSLQPIRFAALPSDFINSKSTPKDFHLLLDNNRFNDILTFFKIGYHRRAARLKDAHAAALERKFPNVTQEDIGAQGGREAGKSCDEQRGRGCDRGCRGESGGEEDAHEDSRR